MSAAIRAKTAMARANIAIRIIMRKRGSGGFTREMDNCFEMGDGEQVYQIVLKRIQKDPEFRRACLRTGCKVWVDAADALEVHTEPALF